MRISTAHLNPPFRFSFSQFFNQELWNQTYGNTPLNDVYLQSAQYDRLTRFSQKRKARHSSRAMQMRKQAFNYWLTQIHNLEKSLAIYLSNSPHMEMNFRRMMEAKSHF